MTIVAPAHETPRLYPILEGRSWGYIDRQGRTVVAPRFKAADEFADGLGLVKEDKTFGFVDASGTVVFDGLAEARAFADGRAAARRGKKYGFVDRSGAFVIAPQFGQCDRFSGGYASVQDAATLQWGVIDVDGSWVFEPGPLGRVLFREGLAVRAAQPGGLFGYVDPSGEFVISPRFSNAHPFSEGLAWVVEGDQPKFIDRSGATVIEGPFLDPGGPPEEHGFREGRVLVRVDRRLGYVGRDEAGLVIAPRFHWASGFSEGRAMAGPDDGSSSTTQQGYIDREGRHVVRPVLYTAGRYQGGLARVHPDGKRETAFGYIDLDGRWVWQPAKGFAASMQDLRA